MKHKLVILLFLTLITISSIAGTSGNLVLRANMPPSYRVEFHSGAPRLVSNVKGIGLIPQLKIERQSNGYIVTVIHP